MYPAGEDYSVSVPRVRFYFLNYFYIHPLLPQQNPIIFPQQRMTDSFDASFDVQSPIDKPTCSSVDSVRNPLKPINGPLDKGWAPWVLPKTTKQYLRATEPGARISFNVELTSGQVCLTLP